MLRTYETLTINLMETENPHPKIPLATELSKIPEGLPDKIIAILPGEAAVQLLMESIQGLSRQAALGWVNHRRKEIIADYHSGYFEKHPERLDRSDWPSAEELED